MYSVGVRTRLALSKLKIHEITERRKKKKIRDYAFCKIDREKVRFSVSHYAFGIVDFSTSSIERKACLPPQKWRTIRDDRQTTRLVRDTTIVVHTVIVQ